MFTIVPVPYEATTTYVKGTKAGPAAILKAFRRFFGAEAIRSLELTGSIGRLVVSEAGAKRLKAFSKRQQVSKRAVIDRIVGGNV